MANNIALDPSVLRDQSKQLDNLAKVYEGFYQKVEAEFGSINANWGSDLVANFVDKITKFKSTETELIESLKSAAKKAEAAACLYEQADASLKTSDVASISEKEATEIIEKSKRGKAAPNITDSNVGKVVASIYDKNGNMKSPYKQYKVSSSSYYGGDLECAGYAKARFEELTGVKPSFSGNAIEYIKNYKNDSRFEYVTDPLKIKIPAIAVTRGISTTYGHVIIIEKLTYNKDGSIKDVYFSEGNSGVPDGTLKKKTWNDFANGVDKNGKPSSTRPYGFIQLK